MTEIQRSSVLNSDRGAPTGTSRSTNAANRGEPRWGSPRRARRASGTASATAVAAWMSGAIQNACGFSVPQLHPSSNRSSESAASRRPPRIPSHTASASTSPGDAGASTPKGQSRAAIRRASGTRRNTIPKTIEPAPSARPACWIGPSSQPEPLSQSTPTVTAASKAPATIRIVDPQVASRLRIGSPLPAPSARWTLTRGTPARSTGGG